MTKRLWSIFALFAALMLNAGLALGANSLPQPLNGIFDTSTGALIGVAPDGAAGATVRQVPTVDANGLINNGSKIAPAFRNIQGGYFRPGTVRVIPREGAPTLTYNSSAQSAQQISGAVNNAANTKNFAFYGFPVANMATRSAGASILYAARSVSNTTGAPKFLTSFYVTDSAFDLRLFQDNFFTSLWIDGQYVGRFTPWITSGTLASGGTTTVTLAASATATTGYYNQYYLHTTGGTGAGQIRQITGYTSGRVATLDSALSPAADGTTTYAVEENPLGIDIDPAGSGTKYLTVTFPTQTPSMPARHLVQVVSSSFGGVQISNFGAVSPGPPFHQAYCAWIGDSYVEGTSAPNFGPEMIWQASMEIGCEPISLGIGSRGLYTRGINNRLSVRDSVAPPAEAWEVQTPGNNGASSGTFNITLNYNGASQTLTFAYNAGASAVESTSTGLNSVTWGSFNPQTNANCPWVGPSTASCIEVARGDLLAPLIIIANGMPGATLTVDSTNSVGGSATVAPYIGDFAKNYPTDANGNALPLLTILVNSGNDPAATGYTDAQLQANETVILQKLASYPTNTVLVEGVLTNSAGSGGNGIITQTDLNHNAAAFAAVQAVLAKVNGKWPWIDTYIQGLNGEALWTGTGTVANPTSTKRDFMNSITATGHPTGVGEEYLAGYEARTVLDILH